MITIGNFFYKYRNGLFIILYLPLFIPSPPLFSKAMLGYHYYLWPIIIGLAITVSGQLIRGATIGLKYIIRGGNKGKVFADELVTSGFFNHCRNPLYLGNILMLLGVGILSNSLLYVFVIIPVFIFIYQSIVLAEENFLLNKFGNTFIAYCHRVNRWIPKFKGITTTFASMEFKWKRWLIKEYNTQFVWLTGICLILFLKYPQLTSHNGSKRNLILLSILPLLLIYYFAIRYLKKSRKWMPFFLAGVFICEFLSKLSIDAYSADSIKKGYNKQQVIKAVHVAAATLSGATLVHDVQMMNRVNSLLDEKESTVH